MASRPEWSFSGKENGTGYAIHSIQSNGIATSEFMHVKIAKRHKIFVPGMEIDHKDSL